MKAWVVSGTNDDCGCSIVFANSRNEAKKKAMYMDACEGDRYIDIQAQRLPKLDGYQDAKPKDNPWLNEDVRLILVREYGWHCFEPDIEDCEECVARLHCDYYGNYLENEGAEE